MSPCLTRVAMSLITSRSPCHVSHTYSCHTVSIHVSPPTRVFLLTHPPGTIRTLAHSLQPHKSPSHLMQVPSLPMHLAHRSSLAKGASILPPLPCLRSSYLRVYLVYVHTCIHNQQFRHVPTWPSSSLPPCLFPPANTCTDAARLHHHRRRCAPSPTASSLKPPSHHSLAAPHACA